MNFLQNLFGRRKSNPAEGVMVKKVKRKVILVLVVLVLVMFAVGGFVTPGYLRYKHRKMDMGMFGTQEIRTDRFTGRTQVYGDGKWQPIEIKGNEVRIPPGTTIEVK